MYGMWHSGHERVRLTLLGDDFARHVGVEKLGDGLDALVTRDLRHVGRRLDA
jgi:hypothetical protein